MSVLKTRGRAVNGRRTSGKEKMMRRNARPSAIIIVQQGLARPTLNRENPNQAVFDLAPFCHPQYQSPKLHPFLHSPTSQSTSHHDSRNLRPHPQPNSDRSFPPIRPRRLHPNPTTMHDPTRPDRSERNLILLIPHPRKSTRAVQTSKNPLLLPRPAAGSQS